MAWDDNVDPDSPVYLLATNESRVIRSLAGPGSGKSFAIKKKIEKLLLDNVEARKILAITFTRTAAADLKKDISEIEVEDAENVEARTVHSHAFRLILTNNILETTGRSSRILIEHESDPALRDIDINGIDIRGKKILLSEYLAAWAKMQHDEPGYAQNALQIDFEEKLVEWLQFHKCMLVGEVIPIGIQYLRSNPASSEIGRYSYILVDEFQDLNRSEQEYIRYILGDSKLVIVGDDDQSIYGFKYAFPDGIRSVEQTYGRFQDVIFNISRRCPKAVTRMASALISRNQHRSLGDLLPYQNNQEGIVQIVQWITYDEENLGLARIIQKTLEDNEVAPQDVLVLAPRRKIGYRLRDELVRLRVPVKSYFRESCITDARTRHAYSLLQLLAKPNDLPSLRYLIGEGSSDFRKNAYSVLRRKSIELHLPVRAILDMVDRREIKIPGISSLLQKYRTIVSEVSDLKGVMLSDPNHVFENFFIHTSDDAEVFLELKEILDIVLRENPQSGDMSVEDISSWLDMIMESFTEKITMPEYPTDIDHVRIMSLHASKGLSAKFVIVMSMVNGLMPAIPNGLDEEARVRCIEEQRRLFYVAMTRCKSSETGYPGRLIISSFIQIYGLELVRMNVPSNPNQNRNMSASLFMSDFGRTAPSTVLGDSLLEPHT